MKSYLFILIMICLVCVSGCVNPLEGNIIKDNVTPPPAVTVVTTAPVVITQIPTPVVPVITPVITQIATPTVTITPNVTVNVTPNITVNVTPSYSGNVSNMTVTFMNVGQGDSEYIVSPTGKTMLIDAGDANKAYMITTEIDVKKIDVVVATHPHADHIGGMKTIFNTYTIGSFIDSGYPYTSSTYENMLTAIEQKKINYSTVKSGDTINFDPVVKVNVLNPQPKFFDEINDNSVVLQMTYKNVSFLFAGDTQLNAETMYAKNLQHVNVLKVAHHGSATSTGAYLISKTHPNVSVISVGADNNYGHPDTYTIKRLVNDNSTVYRTDKDGYITITTDGNNYSVTTSK